MSTPKPKQIPAHLKKILTTPIDIPDVKTESDLVMWIFMHSHDKFDILENEYKERERALCEYLELPFVDIKQTEVRELIHTLARARNMDGFSFKRPPKKHEWKGDKGVVLYIQIELERLKSPKASEEKLVESVAKEHYRAMYDKGTSRGLCNHYHIIKDHPTIKTISNIIESKKYPDNELHKNLSEFIALFL